MKHLKNITDIEQTIADNRLCLFYIKVPDCGVCNVMLDKVARLADQFPSLTSFYTDITKGAFDSWQIPGLFRANSIASDEW